MPSISYRYAVFSGDDPDTKDFERWDLLLSTGLGIRQQGISFGKIVAIRISPPSALNRNLYRQAIASYAMPGEALRDLGADENWSTLQLSLYRGL